MSNNTHDIFSMEAEQAVLGSVLVNPDCIEEVLTLKAEHFHIVRHQKIWGAMVAAHNDPKMAVDYITVMTAVGAEPAVASYLLDLQSKTPSSLGVEGYAKIVIRLATRRRLLRAAQEAARLAHSEDTAIEQVLGKALALFEGVNDEHERMETTVKSINAVAQDVLLQTSMRMNDPTEVPGMKCGLEPVDKATMGFEQGKIYYITGRPGMGKSAMLCQMATGFARNGNPVLIFSLEMSASDMIRRMACQEARVSNYKVRTGKLSDDEFERFQQGIARIVNLPVYIVEDGGLTVAQMKAAARRYEREHGIKVVMVDTLNRVGDVGQGKDMYHGMTAVSNKTADWAHSSEYAVIVAAQMNRANAHSNDKRPSLHSLRDAGAQEQDADVVLGIHREFYYNPDKTDKQYIAEIIPLKHREGSINGIIEMYFNADWPGFARLQPDGKSPVKADIRDVLSIQRYLKKAAEELDEDVENALGDEKVAEKTNGKAVA